MALISYEQAFMERIYRIDPKADISKIHLLSENTACNILQEILETGCLSGNCVNIIIARKVLSSVSSKWLFEYLPKVVPKCLFKEVEWQEWEFRRMAEMLQTGFPDSFI